MKKNDGDFMTLIEAVWNGRIHVLYAMEKPGSFQTKANFGKLSRKPSNVCACWTIHFIKGWW